MRNAQITLAICLALAATAATAQSQAPVEPVKESNYSQAVAEFDARFVFRQHWITFTSEYNDTQSASIYPGDFSNRERSEAVSVVAYTEHSNPAEKTAPKIKEKNPPNPGSGAFLPTVAAEFAKVNNTHLALRDGAVIVRATQLPVFISTGVRGQKVMTRIARGALVMVSVLDDRMIVINLADTCCGALICYVPAANDKGLSPVAVPAGQMIEVFSQGDQACSNPVADKVLSVRSAGNDLQLQVSRCNYARALKRYNLLSVLDACIALPTSRAHQL